MGHVLLIFGSLIAINFGIGYEVSDKLYEKNQGVVEVQEFAAVDASIKPFTDEDRTLTN